MRGTKGLLYSCGSHWFIKYKKSIKMKVMSIDIPKLIHDSKLWSNKTALIQKIYIFFPVLVVPKYNSKDRKLSMNKDKD